MPRHAVAVSFEADQADRRDAFGMLDEAEEGRRHRHLRGTFLVPVRGVGSVRLLRMRDFLPRCPAPFFEPRVQLGQRAETQRALPDPVAGITYLILQPAFLPAGGWLAMMAWSMSVMSGTSAFLMASTSLQQIIVISMVLNRSGPLPSCD